MNSKKIVGIVIAVVVIALMVMMMSQTSSTKPAQESKVQEQQAAQAVAKIDEGPSEEEKMLQDLKKQAGASLDHDVSVFYTVRCSSCHGKGGEGTIVAPAIAGKSYDYILEKIDDYRNNRVQNSLMQGLLTNVSEDDAKILAQEISKFK